MEAASEPHGDLMRELAIVEASYRRRHPNSERRHALALRHMPGGNTRSVLHYSPFPLAWQSGSGNRLTDIDGREYLDLLGEYSAGLYGHSNPAISAAIKRAVDDGMALGGPNRYEAPLAEAICARFPSMELVRFTNSGTEANLLALSLARIASPGRTRVMAFEGAYHGGVLDFRNGGSALNVPFDWVVGRYNDADGARALIGAHATTLAAVIVEPVLGGGCIPGTDPFLRALRDETSRHGIALVVDEVMTSRLALHGLHGALGIRPDLVTIGKYAGGGSSFGAFGGRRQFMERLDPSRPGALPHAGTFNNNVLSMAGGLAGLTEVFTPSEAVRINNLGDRLRDRLNERARRRRAPFLASGVGSLIGLHFVDDPTPLLRPPAGSAAIIEARRSIETLFHLELLEQGYHFSRRGYISLSLPTTEADCDNFTEAVDAFLGARGELLRATIDAARADD